MLNGSWSLQTAGASANSALAETIASGVIDPTLPSGSIGNLASQIHRGTATPLLSITDFGRGLFTVLTHSANNSSRVHTAMRALSGVQGWKFVPDDHNVGSPTWKAYALLSGTLTLQSVSEIAAFPGTQQLSVVDGNAVATPDEDTRTETLKAIAGVVEPTVRSTSGGGLITALDRVLRDRSVEGFFVIDEKTPKEFWLYTVAETSVTDSFLAGGLANLDANSHVATYAVASNASAGASSSPI